MNTYLNRQKNGARGGFTMVELIAVLIIIGILAAIAIPRYMDISDQARNQAALSGVAEAKSTLSVCFAAAILATGGTQPTRAQVYAQWPGGAIASGDNVTFGDVVVTIANNANATDIDITTVSVNGVNVTAATTQTWVMPTIN